MIQNITRHALPIATIATVFLLASPHAAHAYIDPGTGGMLLQLLLGGVAGALVIIKLYWFRVRQTVGRLFGSKPKPEKADTE